MSWLGCLDKPKNTISLSKYFLIPPPAPDAIQFFLVKEHETSCSHEVQNMIVISPLSQTSAGISFYLFPQQNTDYLRAGVPNSQATDWYQSVTCYKPGCTAGGEWRVSKQAKLHLYL